MPSLFYSTPSYAQPAGIQGLYGWFFQEPVQHIDCNPPVYREVITLRVEHQLDIFPEGLIGDDFRFKFLVDRWRLQRGSTSSTTEMVLCPAYQEIIGMGPRAIPLILAELVSEGDDPDHWFWALQVLAGVNPVSEEDEGNLRMMSLAWLAWAASQGYAW